MANRYIYHGAAFNGDGTSPDQATSDGGVGAWNTINYLQTAAYPPAYGTLPAGTSVYIRTKDASGNDITVDTPLNVTIGSTAATEAAPIDWYFDDGEVWPGVQGVVKYLRSASTNYSTSATSFNNFYSSNYNFIVESLATTLSTQASLIGFGRCNTRKIKLSVPNINTSAGATRIAFSGNSLHENLWVVSCSRLSGAMVLNAAQTCVTLISPKIELIASPGKNGPAFGAGFSNSHSQFLVFGGEVFGSGATTGTPLVSFVNPGGRFDSFGLKFPQTMDLAPLASFPTNTITSIATATACDGKFGNAYADYFCALTARYDGYYPTLNASLSDSAGTPWSYALFPYRTGPMNPARVAMAKTYTQDPSIKTVTVNLLWPNSMAAPTSDQVWMQVMYYDATTGQQVSLTTKTQAATALATNSALWSAATYGPTNFSKRQISIDTPTAIAKDTDVMVLLWSAPVAGSASDIIIICPDVLLS